MHNTCAHTRLQAHIRTCMRAHTCTGRCARAHAHVTGVKEGGTEEGGSEGGLGGWGGGEKNVSTVSWGIKALVTADARGDGGI